MSIFSRAVKRSESSTAKPVNLKLVKVNFWSAVRFAFVLTVAMGIGLVVALTIVFLIMNVAGFSNLLKSFVGLEVTLPAVLSVALSIALFIIFSLAPGTKWSERRRRILSSFRSISGAQ